MEKDAIRLPGQGEDLFGFWMQCFQKAAWNSKVAIIRLGFRYLVKKSVWRMVRHFVPKGERRNKLMSRILLSDPGWLIRRVHRDFGLKLGGIRVERTDD